MEQKKRVQENRASFNRQTTQKMNDQIFNHYQKQQTRYKEELVNQFGQRRSPQKSSLSMQEEEQEEAKEPPVMDNKSVMDNLPLVLSTKLREVYSDGELKAFSAEHLMVAIGVQASLIELDDNNFDTQRLVSFRRFVESVEMQMATIPESIYGKFLQSNQKQLKVAKGHLQEHKSIINFISTALVQNEERMKHLTIDSESLEDFQLGDVVKVTDKVASDNAVALCEMLLSRCQDVTLQDLFGFDLEARDVLNKRSIAKLWDTIDEIEEKNINGLRHLKNEMTTLIDKKVATLPPQAEEPSQKEALASLGLSKEVVTTTTAPDENSQHLLKLITQEVDSLYQRMHQVQSTELQTLSKDLLKTLEDDTTTTTTTVRQNDSYDQEATSLQERIKKILEKGTSAIGQRSKYLVVQNRGLDAYQNLYNESPFETQRQLSFTFSTHDQEVSQIVTEVKKLQESKARTDTQALLNQLKEQKQEEAVTERPAALTLSQKAANGDLSRFATQLSELSDIQHDQGKMLINLKDLYEQDTEAIRKTASTLKKKLDGDVSRLREMVVTQAGSSSSKLLLVGGSGGGTSQDCCIVDCCKKQVMKLCAENQKGVASLRKLHMDLTGKFISQDQQLTSFKYKLEARGGGTGGGVQSKSKSNLNQLPTLHSEKRILAFSNRRQTQPVAAVYNSDTLHPWKKTANKGGIQIITPIRQNSPPSSPRQISRKPVNIRSDLHRSLPRQISLRDQDFVDTTRIAASVHNNQQTALGSGTNTSNHRKNNGNLTTRVNQPHSFQARASSLDMNNNNSVVVMNTSNASNFVNQN